MEKRYGIRRDKEMWKSLSNRQKWQYFCDYYLIKVIAIIIILVFLVQIFFATVINRTENILTVAFINDGYDIEAEKIEKELKDYLGVKEKHKSVSVVFYNTKDAESNMALITRLNAGIIDVVVTDESTFKTYVEEGAIQNIKKYLTSKELEKFKDQMIGEEGIDIAQSKKFQALNSQLEKPVLGVLKISLNEENVKKAITYFLGDKNEGDI